MTAPDWVRNITLEHLGTYATEADLAAVRRYLSTHCISKRQWKEQFADILDAALTAHDDFAGHNHPIGDPAGDVECPTCAGETPCHPWCAEPCAPALRAASWRSPSRRLGRPGGNPSGPAQAGERGQRPPQQEGAQRPRRRDMDTKTESFAGTTPGPWRADIGTNPNLPARVIADNGCGAGCPCQVAGNIMPEDAALIAAAPALLAERDALREQIGGIWGLENDLYAVNDRCDTLAADNATLRAQVAELAGALRGVCNGIDAARLTVGYGEDEASCWFEPHVDSLYRNARAALAKVQP